MIYLNSQIMSIKHNGYIVAYARKDNKYNCYIALDIYSIILALL